MADGPAAAGRDGAEEQNMKQKTRIAALSTLLVAATLAVPAVVATPWAQAGGSVEMSPPYGSGSRECDWGAGAWGKAGIELGDVGAFLLEVSGNVAGSEGSVPNGWEHKETVAVAGPDDIYADTGWLTGTVLRGQTIYVMGAADVFGGAGFVGSPLATDRAPGQAACGATELVDCLLDLTAAPIEDCI